MTTLAELKHRRVHFIGIGGSGMSGIARIMLDLGIKVSGSDAKANSIISGLQALGATISIGHDAANVNNVDVVIASSAIAKTNVEFAAAISAGIEILSRAEALALLMSESVGVAVAGTHGKTTTTSMLTVALQSAGLDPSFAIGGMINTAGTNAHRGNGEIFVAEADESDGSFLVYRPTVAIITNIELDHVDHFSDFESVLSLFQDFVRTIRPNGFLIACADDSGVRALLERNLRSDITVITYGSESTMRIDRVHLERSGAVARITYKGRVMGNLELSVPGKHNIWNAAAALTAGICLGASPAELLRGLKTFTGARRRFEVKGTERGVTVVDDYGHHPTEVDVTIQAALRFAEGGRVLVIFQPHRYSRTSAFAADFASALSQADEVYLLEVYPAGEAPIPGVSANLILQAVPSNLAGKFHYEPSMVAVAQTIAETAKFGDLVMTLGAGDVSSLAPVILDAIRERE